ncbi:spore coat protein [Anaerobacillus arseniciselenatis]|nr:spore coat protein [Anaerobacillus arseniciselenatis]
MFFPRPRPGMHAPVAPVQQQMMPPRVHPTQHYVKHKCCEYIVPEVHPSHTTIVQDHMYKHYHNFPHTQSVVDRVGRQDFICPPGPPVNPGMPVGGMGAPGMAPRRRFF